MSTDLKQHESRIDNDLKSNPVKLLAYDISKAVEERSFAFRDIEALVKSISDESAIKRARRLHYWSGVSSENTLDDIIRTLAMSKADEGFDVFKPWAQS